MSLNRPIVLTGFMGAGKSSLGAAAAERYDIPFYDNDAHIVSRAEMTIPDIFSQHGEDYFRQIEADTFAQLVQPDIEHRGIIATGGGIISQEVGRNALRQADATIVWLFVDFETAAKRVGDDPNRPLFRDRSKALGLFEERQRHYRKTARFLLDTTNKSIEEMIDYLDTYF